jgi:hypothetical protein
VEGFAQREVEATFYFFSESGLLLYQDQRTLPAGQIEEPFGQQGEAMDIARFLPVGTQTMILSTRNSVVGVRHIRMR